MYLGCWVVLQNEEASFLVRLIFTLQRALDPVVRTQPLASSAAELRR